MKNIIQNIAEQNNLELNAIQALAGGDINKVFLLKATERDFVVKINNVAKFPKMFEAEAKGLDLLRNTNGFIIPQVFMVGEVLENSYILMEYLKPSKNKAEFRKEFSQHLALLHSSTNDNFGLDHNNYIGSLPQTNTPTPSASQFYIEQRLQPQIEIAFDKGFNFHSLHSVLKNIAELIPIEKPSLIHGDLWHGNHISNKSGKPALIDPAVSFAPREMDIAMMKLFGGFSEEIYSAYNSIFPLEAGWVKRLPIWQLYYLLVHLNIFGSQYLGSVNAIFSKYR